LLFIFAGPCDWGQSSYGILEVTWTSLAPKYGQDDEARTGIKGKRIRVLGPYERRFFDCSESNYSNDSNFDIHGSHGNGGSYTNYATKQGNKIQQKQSIVNRRIKEVSSVIPCGTPEDNAARGWYARPTPTKYILIEDNYAV